MAAPPTRADVGFHKGGCTIYLKGAPEVERQMRRGGRVSGRVCALSPENFLYFLYQNGEFLCIPGDFYLLNEKLGLATCFAIVTIGSS